MDKVERGGEVEGRDQCLAVALGPFVTFVVECRAGGSTRAASVVIAAVVASLSGRGEAAVVPPVRLPTAVEGGLVTATRVTCVTPFVVPSVVTPVATVTSWAVATVVTGAASLAIAAVRALSSSVPTVVVAVVVAVAAVAVAAVVAVLSASLAALSR